MDMKSEVSAAWGSVHFVMRNRVVQIPGIWEWILHLITAKQPGLEIQHSMDWLSELWSRNHPPFTIICISEMESLP